MEELLFRIMTIGMKERDGRQFISELLFNVLTGFQEFSGLAKFQIKNVQYIEVDSIPDEIRDTLGLFRPLPTFSNESWERKFKEEFGVDFNTLPPPPPIEKKEGSDAEWDIDHAIARAKNYKHE